MVNSGVGAALLSLLSGGVQGYAEAGRKNRAEKTRKTERQQDLNIASQKDQAQLDLQQEELGQRASQFTAGQAQNQSQFESTQSFEKSKETTRAGEKAKEIGIESDTAKYQARIAQAQARIAELQNRAEIDSKKFDPYQVIQHAVAEVYTKNATGDDPSIAGDTANKAASDLFSIFQKYGVIPTPLGPPASAAEGASSTGDPAVDRALQLTHPQHPYIPILSDIQELLSGTPTPESERIGFGPGKKRSSLSDTLRTVK